MASATFETVALLPYFQRKIVIAPKGLERNQLGCSSHAMLPLAKEMTQCD